MEIATFSKLFREVLLAGLILLDGTKAFRAPGDKEAVALYDTGTRVEIIQERQAAGGAERLYQIKRDGGPVWVEAKAVQVIATDEAAQGLPLAFYLRAAKNKDEAARTLAAGGLMRGLKGSELMDAWIGLQRDQADEVRCAANESFSARAVKEGLLADPRFNGALLDALLRVRREGGWGDKAVCGLDGLLMESSHPDQTALECMLAQRQLGSCPAQAGARERTRALELLRQGLTYPEAWVRGSIIRQVCGEDITDDAVKTLTALFSAMTPEDKTAVIADCGWPIKDKPAAGPLRRLIAGLIGDKSQPAKLRLSAVDWARYHGIEHRQAVRSIMSDPRDELRFDLAGRYCKHRDIVEAAANLGDEAVFSSAMMCLDKLLAGRKGPDLPASSLAEWSKPSLAAALQAIARPERRARLERPLKCLLGQALCPVSMPAGGL